MRSLTPATHVAAFTSFARATARGTRTAALLLFSVAGLLAGGAAAVRGQSAVDGFDPNANGGVRVVVVQPDGKILIGGDFTTLSPNGGVAVTRNGIARLNPDGTLDTAFDPNAGTFGNVYSIALQADGKILAGGFFTSIGGQTRNNIARLDATTGLADGFNPNANGFGVSSIALQADGKILAGGFFTSIGGQTRNNIARLDATTGLADGFNPNANGIVVSIAIQADGKILAGGFLTNVGGQTRNNIARLETDGRLDQTLDLSIGLLDGIDVFATAMQPDGKILIGGRFTTVLGVARNFIARLNPDGTLDTAFNPNANDFVDSIAVQADGKILVGGDFHSIGSQTRNYIARLDATTGLADSFDPNADSGVLSIVVQADGKILVGGQFHSIGSQTRNYIARLDATTGVADSFDAHANNNSSYVGSIVVQADGKILVGGAFFGPNSMGGQTRNWIARLDPTTGLADSFDPNADSFVLSIAVQADGKILAGGDFTSIGGQTRNSIARLDATTGLADSFDPNGNGGVLSIVAQADGKILVGGVFTSIGGQTRNGIVRLDATTGLADSFDPNADYIVWSIAVQTDGKILIGGGFRNIGGTPRNLFARLSNDTAALQNLAVTQTTISWTHSGSSPQFTRVAFEYSADNVNYTPLGNGTASGDNWTLTGLHLPTGQNLYIRARGYYRSGADNGSESITESVRNAFLTLASQAINLSTRMLVQTGDNVGIGGFIITGSAPKQVLLRGIGPSLTAFGVPDALVDPVLEFGGITNDNWMDTQGPAILATGLAPTNDLESAILVTLNPGPYTVILKGKNNGTGVGLVEVYDLAQAVASKLANLSTRAFVSTGSNIVIAGFILGDGTMPDNVLVRGIGPSLARIGVPNALADPRLELRNSNGTLLRADDNWQDDPAQAALITATGLAPTNPLESAIAQTLGPGQYTALLSGLNNGTGVGVVEVYDLGAP